MCEKQSISDYDVLSVSSSNPSHSLASYENISTPVKSVPMNNSNSNNNSFDLSSFRKPIPTYHCSSFNPRLKMNTIQHPVRLLSKSPSLCPVNLEPSSSFKLDPLFCETYSLTSKSSYSLQIWNYVVENRGKIAAMSVLGIFLYSYFEKKMN